MVPVNLLAFYICIIYFVLHNPCCCVNVDNETIQRKFNHLENILSDVIDENKDLKMQVHKLTGKLSALEENLKTAYEDIAELRKTRDCMNTTESTSRDRRVIIPPTSHPNSTAVTPNMHTVAFFATVTSHQEHLGIHQTIGFPEVVTNEGKGWDVLAGLFRVPEAGLYYFNANIMSHYAEDIETELVKNGNVLITSYVGDRGTHAMSTLSAVLRLELGDEIWIRISSNLAINNNNVRIFGNGGSWFCGFLISK